MKLRTFVTLLAPFMIAVASAATVIDDFESNSFSGGTGWTNNWTTTGSGSFIAGAQIDGSHAGALYGTSSLSRNFSSITTGTVTANWSIKGIGGTGAFNEIGVNILGLKSNSQSNVITLKFDDDFLTTLRLNDGGVDFSSGGVGYLDSTIYDFSFTSTIGSSNYSWSVSQRGGGSASGTNFAYSGFGTTLTHVSGITFFWSADAGAGRDGFLDNVSIVPEPTSAALGLIGSLALLRRRRA
jgi:hypothetical protein